MPEQKEDRRVQRTRQLLRDALEEAAQEKGYESISIQDISDRANLGRATFYLHYKDKDELLFECIDLKSGEWLTKIQSLPLFSETTLKIVFEFARQNANIFKIMMHEPVGLKVSHRLQKIVSSQLVASMEKEQSQHSHPLVPLEFLGQYYAGSILAVIEWWIDNHMNYSNEEMVNMILLSLNLDRAKIMGLK